MYKRNNLAELIQQASILTRLDLKDKVVLLRSCLNLTFNSEGKIDDITRLEEAYPTIEALAKLCKKLIVFAHMGRPTGIDKKYSLSPVYHLIQPKLQDLAITSDFVENIDGVFTSNAKVSVLENIRFFEGEESSDENKQLELINKFKGVDYFVNDAFPDYRESVSTYYITHHFKSFLGPNYIKEVKALSNLNNPIKPYIAVVGGAKLSEKLDILVELAKSTDKVLIGGAMAYTFLKAQNIPIGNSLYEDDKLGTATEILNIYKDKIVLPVDHLVSNEFSEGSSYSSKFTTDKSVPDNTIAIDIGPKTIALYSDHLKSANTILINGPLGVFEWEKSIEGSKRVYAAAIANKNAYKVLGGGDSIACVNKLRLTGFNHISTGGGAMLAFLSKDHFPTLDVILDQFDS